MTNVSSRHSSRSRSHSRHAARSRSRSRTGTPRSPYANYRRSASHSLSRSRSRSASRSRSRSRYSESRSRSRSRSARPGSWSRSRSPSQGVASYSSRSRSRTRSRSPYAGGRRHGYASRSRSRSHPSGRSRSRSNYSSSPVQFGSKDPRDRSKRMNWGNSIWLVGEKAKDVVFHFCDICDLPIVIYGRLLPCKHVLCYQCAAKLPNKCNRCQKSVQTIERCLVGGIFMCFESDSCRRTYLSQRDLQAHIDHRHRGGITSGSTTATAAVEPTKANISTSQTTPSKVLTEDSEKQLLPPGPAAPVSISTDPMSLLQSLQRPSNLTQCTSNAVSSAPLGFATGNKNIGLLPLPSSSTSLPPSRIPVNVAPPARPPSHPPTAPPFPQMMQFSTPPPPLAPRAIPPPSVMNPSVPPPAIPAPRSQPTSFSSTNAVAALAAAAAAMSGNQAKPPTMQVRSNSLLSAPPSVVSTGPLQPTGLNLSLLTNALIGGNSTWSRANTLANLSNIRPSSSTSSTSSRLPQSGASGSLNIGRFPF